MASYSYNSNVVASDPNQYFTLNVTFEDDTFTWSVIPKRQDGQTGNVVRNAIYGLTVTIGGNSYYIGDIPWGNYYVGSSVKNGTTPLSICTINSGVVSVSLTGNYYYGTWNPDYKCSINTSIAIVSPTVSLPSFTVGRDYSNKIVAGYSTLDFTFSATPGSGGTITRYRLYQDGSLVYDGSAASCSITAPPAGTHTYYVIATESNGATGQSGSVSVTSVLYTPPSFNSVSSIRWSTGLPTGVASDVGAYAKLSATFVSATVDGDPIPTACSVTLDGSTGTISTSGNSIFLGGSLSADSSYDVTYNLYDDLRTSAFPITRTDIISIGGRGIDLIRSNGEYGIGFNMKASPGHVDSGLPLRINEVTPSGSITAQAEVQAEPKALTVTFTKTDNNSTANLTSYTVKQWGRMVQVTIHLTNQNYASDGSVMWGGTITGLPTPIDTVTGVGNNGSNHCIGQIYDNSGTITMFVRAMNGYQSNWTANLSFTFLV